MDHTRISDIDLISFLKPNKVFKKMKYDSQNFEGKMGGVINTKNTI